MKTKTKDLLLKWLNSSIRERLEKQRERQRSEKYSEIIGGELIPMRGPLLRLLILYLLYNNIIISKLHNSQIDPLQCLPSSGTIFMRACPSLHILLFLWKCLCHVKKIYAKKYVTYNRGTWHNEKHSCKLMKQERYVRIIEYYGEM